MVIPEEESAQVLLKSKWNKQVPGVWRMCFESSDFGLDLDKNDSE